MTTIDELERQANQTEVREDTFPITWDLVPQVRESFRIHMYFNGEIIQEFYREMTGQEFLVFVTAFYPQKVDIKIVHDNDTSYFYVLIPYRETIEF